MLMEREPAFLRDKGNISMFMSNCNRKLYQLGKNLATWKLMEIIPFVSCEPHLIKHNFYQEVGEKFKIEKNPNKYNKFSSLKMLLDVR